MDSRPRGVWGSRNRRPRNLAHLLRLDVQKEHRRKCLGHDRNHALAHLFKHGSLPPCEIKGLGEPPGEKVFAGNLSPPKPDGLAEMFVDILTGY